MKKFLCVFCSLVIMVMCLCGCGSNPFTADDAKKGQIGDLCYAIPGNAVSEKASNDDSIVYLVPIENSVEEYQLNIGCTYITKEDAESKEDVLESFDKFIDYIEEIASGSDVKYSREDIDKFAGTAVDKAIKISGEGNGAKTISIFALKSRKVYSAGYSVKTGFFDQSVWDNFYKQLKYVGSDDNGDNEYTSVSEDAAEDNSINIFNDENSITVVSGNLSYSIPGSVQDQYHEKLKDAGFELSVLQSYDILEVGKIEIYSSNLYHNEEACTTINDLGLSYAKLANTRADMKIYEKDEFYTFSTFNGINIDYGYDMYMYTDNDDIEILSLFDSEVEEVGEVRVIYMMKGLSSYFIKFQCELGKYNKQVIDTFLNSIEFISLEDF